MNIESVLKEKEQLVARVRKLDAFIEAAQEICTHDWMDSGRDSHHSWQKCKKCTLEEEKC